jgi:uncharacterized protein YerC
MKAISAAQRSSIISLLNDGYSLRQIRDKTGLGKSTVGRISKKCWETRKTVQEAALPSFLLVTDTQLFNKFTLGG